MAEFLKVGSTTIGYVSDLEGNWDYWNAYVELSLVLRRDEHGVVQLNDFCCFVHGGDVVDRGSGDLRILRDLISLKRRYRDRVFFIIGNRDANKLRLPFSLHPKVLQLKPHAFWVAENQVPADFPLNNRVERLKWVLKATMGAPFAFECHRQELKDLLPGETFDDEKIVNSFLTLIDPTSEENLLLEYLELGSMSVVIGDTMFVHGAITSYQLGYVPPSFDANHQRIPEQFCPDPIRWTQLINQFLANELADYRRRYASFQQQIDQASPEELSRILWDYAGDYDAEQPGSRLVQCGMGMKKDKSINPGVIYASYLKDGKPVKIDEPVRQWLQAHPPQIIRNVIVGHQPNGDTPLIMKHLGIQTISADSSYSKLLMWPVKDLVRTEWEEENKKPRPEVDVTSEEFAAIDKFLTTKLGVTIPPPTAASDQANTRSKKAVNETFLTFEAPVAALLNPASGAAVEGKVHVHGKISVGAEYLSHASEDRFVGKETNDGWWVKAANAKFPGQVETYYVLAHSEGFNFRSKLVPASEIDRYFAK